MSHAAPPVRKTAIAMAALVIGALATGAAFAGWADHGVDIFLTMAEAGLAWCL